MMFERPASVHRIERCYRRIGSCADFQPAFQEGTKRVHLRRTLLTESQLIKLPGVSPLRIERRLYRHGQAEHRRALNLIGRGQFAVLDSMPARAEVPSLTRIERLVNALPAWRCLLDRRVADRVQRDLKARQMGVADKFTQVVV